MSREALQRIREALLGAASNAHYFSRKLTGGRPCMGEFADCQSAVCRARLGALAALDTMSAPAEPDPTETAGPAPVAKRLFKAQSDLGRVEDEIGNLLDKTMPSGWEDFTYDGSDNSLEVYGCVHPPTEAADLAGLAALGFSLIWVHPGMNRRDCFRSFNCPCQPLVFPASPPPGTPAPTDKEPK